jgi:hypothetical protein
MQFAFITVASILPAILKKLWLAVEWQAHAALSKGDQAIALIFMSVMAGRAIHFTADIVFAGF